MDPRLTPALHMLAARRQAAPGRPSPGEWLPAYVVSSPSEMARDVLVSGPSGQVSARSVLDVGVRAGDEVWVTWGGSEWLLVGLRL